MRPLLLILLLPSALYAPLSIGGSVELTDGRRLEGSIRFVNDQLFIKAGDGTESKLPLTSIRRAHIMTPPRQPPPKGTAASPRAVELAAVKKLEGLRGEYFDVGFTERKLVRIDPRIDFEFPEKEPADPSVPLDFAVRWTGEIQAADQGKHIFSVELHSHDEKVRVWVNDELIIDRWGDRNAAYTGAIDLRADEKYAIKVEYIDERAWGRVRLYWSSPRQGRQVVPAGRLSPPEGTVPPVVAIASPAENTDFVSPGDIALTAQAVDRDGQVRKVEFMVDGTPVGMAEAEPWAVKWTNASSGVHKIVAKAIDDAGITAVSPAVSVAVAASRPDLAAPWAEIPLGRIFQRADATSTGGEVFTLTNANGDLFGERDAMEFALQKLSGDGTLVARLVSFVAPEMEDPGASGTGAAAGLLIREHLNPGGARQAMVGLAPQVGVIFLRREHAWDERKLTEEPDLTLPRWFKLTRSSKNVTASHSADGKKWTPMLTRRIDLPNDVYVGMAVGNPGAAPAKAVFDHVVFTRGGATEVNSVRGVVLTSGSLVGGHIQSVDDTSVRLSGRYGTVSVPTSQVARLVFRPIPAEAADQIQPGRTGAVLGSGDFLDGSVESLKDGHVRIGSVLFGVQRYSIHSDDITAIVLRDAKETPGKFTVRALDGSVFCAKEIVLEKGRLTIVDRTDARFSMGSSDLVEIEAAGQ